MSPVFRPDYPVVTDRLLLRPVDPATDIDAMLAYQSQPEVTRYIPYEPRTREQLVDRLQGEALRSTLEAEGQVINLVVVVRESGRLIGDCILFYLSEQHRSGEIGYVFHPDAHGHGYATEAARALLGLAFDGLGLHRVIARVDARNEASAAVLRRIGMRREGYLRENEWFKGEWTDELDFAILEDEWRLRSAAR